MTGCAEVVAGSAPILLLADHAGRAVPPEVELGVAAADMERHIAVDLGTAALTRALAERLAGPAILGVWSRLVTDLNRGADDPAVVPVESDGTPIPGNAALDEWGRADRIARFHEPYHALVSDHFATTRPELIVSVHSFTPGLKNGTQRPWDAGVLYNRDEWTGHAMLAALAGSGWTVGDQEPYPGTLFNATLDRHTGPGGAASGVPSVLIEVRQDHLKGRDATARVADILAQAIRHVHTGAGTVG